MFVFFFAAQAAAAQPTVSTVRPASEKRICRYETATGTIFSGRICKTRKEWAAFDTAQDRARENRRESNTVDHTGGCTIEMVGTRC